VVGVILTKI